MHDNSRAVIIGGGIAGVQAAASIKGMKITLITDEPYLPYYRMRIEEILQGKAPESLYMHPAQWYEEKGIEVVRGRAERIDTADKSVLMADGSSIPYDSLLIATGSQARKLPLPGERKESFVLRTASDAMALRTALGKASSFTVIGGGLLGLEAASAAAEAFGIPVSVIETAPHILPRQLDEASAEVLQKKLLERGVDVLVSCSCVSASDDAVHLSDGRKVPADVLCFSVGVNPGKEIAEASGIASGRGILVDRFLRTSAPSVYAAGDAAELDGRTFGLAMHAREMGTAAAAAMMGNAAEYAPSEPSALLKVAGIDVISFGVPEGEARVETDGDKRRTFFIRSGIICGAVLINDKASMMSVRAMIGRKA